MKILLFITPYLNLCQPIIDELRSQGHDITILKDPVYPNDPTLRKKKSISENDFVKWNNKVTLYWEENKFLVSKRFDVFISINGISLNETAFQLINKYSPNILKVMYVWDSFNYRNFRILENNFDKLYTFDVLDAKKSKWQLLPSFYIDHPEIINSKPKYDISLIGTNHDGRYSFIRKLLPFIKSEKLTYYIKIFVRPNQHNIKGFIKDGLMMVLRPKTFHDFLFKYNLENNDLKIEKMIEYSEYQDIMMSSNCIIDDNRPNQAGLSPRFIRAVALNKKIITTNQWVYQYSFVNRDNVMIIDKKNFKLDTDFFVKEIGHYKNSNLKFLEISNWVKILIGEIEIPNFTIVSDENKC